LGCRCSLPDDRLMHQVAAILIEPSATRNRLIEGVYRSDAQDDLIGRLHVAMEKSIRAEPIDRKLRKLRQVHRPDQDYGDWLKILVQEQILNQQEADLLSETRQAVREAIMVDDFPADEWG